MSKAGLDNRHINRDGEISHKHGNTTVRTLRKIYGQSFAAGHPETKTRFAGTGVGRNKEATRLLRHSQYRNQSRHG